jgi:hypothetical protein
MVPTRARFSPVFPQAAEFLGEHVFREFSGAPVVIRTTLDQPHFTFVDLFLSFFSFSSNFSPCICNLLSWYYSVCCKKLIVGYG